MVWKKQKQIKKKNKPTRSVKTIWLKNLSNLFSTENFIVFCSCFLTEASSAQLPKTLSIDLLYLPHNFYFIPDNFQLADELFIKIKTTELLHVVKTSWYRNNLHDGTKTKYCLLTCNVNRYSWVTHNMTFFTTATLESFNKKTSESMTLDRTSTSFLLKKKRTRLKI